MFHVLAIVVKIGFASLIVGAGLSFFDITAIEVLSKAGITPERLGQLLTQGFEWALPNIILGSMVIVPLWVVTYMLRPPRG
ncbi:MAG: DUF6460 domain-containing protein [Ahrensia sp.]|nr:DUF6460 domain-containing protein [Ahrensia sp.]